MLEFVILVVLLQVQHPVQEPRSDTKIESVKARRTAEGSGVTLDSTAVIEEGRLKLEYEIHNNAKIPLYVFNDFFDGVDSKGVWHVVPNRILVIYREGRGSLARRVMEVPKDRYPGHRMIPLVVKIDPGKSFRQALSLRLPLDTWDPYSSTVSGDPLTVAAHFTWEVGYFRETLPMSEPGKTVATSAGPAMYCPRIDAGDQSILKTKPFPFPVPLRLKKLQKEQTRDP